jgi:phage-related protein
MSYTSMPYMDLQDSSKYGVEQENQALASSMEGGYVATRPRHTRRPRKTFSSGFTSLTETQKTALQAFFDSVYGGSVIFNWTNPTDGAVIAVRFTTDTKLAFTYSGAGATRRYDVSFKVQEA